MAETLAKILMDLYTRLTSRRFIILAVTSFALYHKNISFDMFLAINGFSVGSGIVSDVAGLVETKIPDKNNNKTP